MFKGHPKVSGRKRETPHEVEVAKCGLGLGGLRQSVGIKERTDTGLTQTQTQAKTQTQTQSGKVWG